MIEDQNQEETWWTFEMVQERLVEAFGFLDRVTPSGHNPYAGDGPWSQIVRDWRVDYGDRAAVVEDGARDRGGLNSVEVDRMEATLGWIKFIPARGNLRRLMGVVILQLLNGGSQPRWADVRRSLKTKQSNDVLRHSYSAAICRIAEKLNA